MLTRSGLGVLVAAVALTVCGSWWGYEELLVLAAGAGVLVGLGLWSTRRRPRIAVSRRLGSLRVARGDPIRLVYRVTNDTRHRSGPATVIDRCDTATSSVRLDPVAPGTASVVGATLATRRRGVFDVGPWELERVDPFGLAIGRRISHDVVQVVVHPKIYPLVGPHGAMQTVESEAVVRRIATDPLSGFVSLREYVEGDDPRLIHWPTTARAGTLMVREHVELRRPEFTVVLDTSTEVATAEAFEEAVDVAASIAVHAVRTGLDVVLRTTSREHPGSLHPITDEGRVLDLLTPVDRSSGVGLRTMPEIFAGGVDRSSVVMVTGPDGPSSRLPSSGRMLTVRIGHGAVAAPGIALAAEDASEFARRWRPWA